MKKNLFLLAALFSSAIVFSQQNKVWVPYREGVRWGYADTLGRIVVKPSYDSVDFFVGESGFVYKKGNVGVVIASGDEAIKPEYSVIEEFAEGFKVSKGKLSGYFSDKGKMILPVQYDDLYTNDEEFIILTKGEKQGISSITGNIVLPVEYDKVMTHFNYDKDELEYIARKGDKYYLFNKKTFRLTAHKFVIEETLEGIKDLDFEMGNDQAGIEKYRQEVIKKLNAEDAVYYDKPRFYMEDVFFIVTVKGKKGVVQYISPDNIKPILPIEYDSVSYVKGNINSPFVRPESEYLSAVAKNGKYGIVNESGAVIIPFEYDNIGALRGYSMGFELQKGDKKGIYLPTTFYPLIAPKYDEVEYATSIPVNSEWEFALYKVIINGQVGYVGENGKEYFK